MSPCFACRSHRSLAAVSEFGTVGKAEIYFKPTDIKRTVIDNDQVYSLIGEIGGFLDIILYAATGLMFLFWSVEKVYYSRTHSPSGARLDGHHEHETPRDSGNVDDDFAMREMIKREGGAGGAML